ncbi:MAG TPA: hypothetical protein VGS20_03830 [Candidatus Acidoferrales bacterium]|nr:hypothetical protein [Candidatus Acidoferrales bacterium]
MSDLASDRLGRLALAFAWFDLGLLVILLPWSPVWESNSLLTRYPSLIPYLLNGYVRGAISGLGVLDVMMAADALFRRRHTAVVTRQ